MSNEYLRKSVADRRTGANLIGVHVDTSNMNNLSPDFTQAFNQLETFAKQSDELKIQNEKKKIQLDIAAQRIKFKTDYLNDPSVYASQEKWDETVALYEADREETKKKIANSKYLSKDERMLLSQSVDLDYKQDWLDPLNKRNGVVIRERVDEATALLQTAINNASADDLYKTDTIENFINTATEIYNPLMKLGISTKGDMNSAIVKGITDIEGARLERKAGAELLYNPLLSVEQKAEEIKKAMSALNSDKRISEIAESMSKEYDFDDYTKEYLKSSLKLQYKKAEEGLNKQLYKLTVQDKTQRELAALYNKQNSKDNKLMEAVEKNDPYLMIETQTGKALTTTEMTAPENSANLQNIYGYTMATFGDPQNSVIGKVVSDIGISGINKQISDARADKTVIVNTEYIAKNIIEPYITENYRNFGDDTAMRKDLGDRIKGLNPTVILKGKNNPVYYSTWDTLKAGKGNTDKFKLATQSKTPLGLSGKGRKRYLELLNENIDRNGTTLNSTKGMESLNQYLIGLIEERKPNDLSIKESAKFDYAAALDRLLKDETEFQNIKESILPVLYNVQVSPINYQQAKLLPYERQAGTMENEVEENENNTRKSI